MQPGTIGLAVHPQSGVPFVSFSDNTAGGRVTVKRLDAGGWRLQGTTGFAGEQFAKTALVGGVSSRCPRCGCPAGEAPRSPAASAPAIPLAG